MNAIWKYSLEDAGRQQIEMPEGARIISVQVQHGIPCLWAIVDPGKPAVRRTFHIIGTGNPFNAAPLAYVGSFQLLNGKFVGHVFEELP
jgi:hypothetical protein